MCQICYKAIGNNAPFPTSAHPEQMATKRNIQQKSNKKGRIIK